jgi:hypothetical protein
LVALAVVDKTPVKTSAGKAKKLPPPATALSVPPRIAAIKSSKISGRVMKKPQD